MMNWVSIVESLGFFIDTDLGKVVFSIFVFLTGAAVASFLLLVVDRSDMLLFGKNSKKFNKLPLGEKLQNLFKVVVFSRSVCDKCGRELNFWELFPVFGRFVVGGKCKKCGYEIPFKYLLEEVGLGLICVIVFLVMTMNGASLLAAALFFVLSTLLYFFAIYDIFYMKVPDFFIFPAIAVLIAARLVDDLVDKDLESFLYYVAAALLAGVFFLIMIVLSRGKGFGLGDVKFAFLAGLMIGVKMWMALFWAIMLGSVIGVLIVWLEFLGKKRTSKGKGLKFSLKNKVIPFVPFLAAGTWITLLWGNKIAAFILSLFRY